MPESVALLVPAYKAARTLPRLAEAARAQTQPFSEWRCYDDASGDDTATCAEQLGFQTIRGKDNRGPSFARNQLAAATQAEWIHFHDADDLLAPEYLAQAIALAKPGCDVVLCDSSWEFEASRERLIHWTYRQADYDTDPLTFTLTRPVGVIAALIRRSAFQAIGGFDEAKTCWEDADLFVRLAENGAKFQMVEQTLVTSLRHDRGISRDQLHCTRCRLQFLRGYVQRQPKRLASVHAAEAEKLIAQFLHHRDDAGAREALDFCRSLGGNPPTTSHPLLRALKPLAPPLWLIRLQHRRRNIAQA